MAAAGRRLARGCCGPQALPAVSPALWAARAPQQVLGCWMRWCGTGLFWGAAVSAVSVPDDTRWSCPRTAAVAPRPQPDTARPGHRARWACPGIRRKISANLPRNKGLIPRAETCQLLVNSLSDLCSRGFIIFRSVFSCAFLVWNRSINFA